MNLAKPLCLGLSLAAILSPSFADNKPAWVKVQPKGAGFEVMMPAAPLTSSQVIKEDGSQYRAYMYWAVSRNLVYKVGYADMNIKLSPSQVDIVLNNVISGAAKVSQSVVVNNEPAEVQGKQARIYSLQNDSGRSVLGMTCWDGRRNYIISISGSAADLQGNVSRDYFKTFKLTAKK